MVGDDVVDLGDPEARDGAQHPRFDARVFASVERAALAESPAAVRLRWILWAAKEAAYKLARKLDPGVVFSPSRFVVSLGPAASEARSEPQASEVLGPDALRGRVSWPGGLARVEVRELGGAVHAIARDGDGQCVLVRGVATLEPGDDPSRAARGLAVRRVARRLGLDPRDLGVVRRGRIPSLALPGGGALELSLSHHGCFVAFACELEGAHPL